MILKLFHSLTVLIWDCENCGEKSIRLTTFSREDCPGLTIAVVEVFPGLLTTQSQIYNENLERY